MLPEIDWSGLSLGVVAILIMAFVVIKLLDEWAKKFPVSEVIQVIKENTEVNARLVATVEAQTRFIQSLQESQHSLLLAITKLITRLEGK